MIYNIIADADETFIPAITSNIIALDGAAEILRKNNIVPQIIIGDFDKVTKSTLDYFAQKSVEIIKIEDQNSTDLDKGIRYCLDHNASTINIYNAIGGRMDHTLYNTRILKKYYNLNSSIKIIHNEEKLEYFEDVTLEINGKTGSRLSIISAPAAILISSGLEYDMHNHKLEYGKTESTSNSLKSNFAKIIIYGGVLINYNAKTKINKKQTIDFTALHV